MVNNKNEFSEDFHNINNLLNKITTQSGMARYRLEQSGFNKDELDKEKDKMITLLSDMEEYAMKIGEILKDLRNSMKISSPMS